MSLCIHKESLWAHFIAKGGVAIHVKIIYIYITYLLLSVHLSVHFEDFTCYEFLVVHLYVICLYIHCFFRKSHCLCIRPVNSFMVCFELLLMSPRDSNYISRQRFYRYFEYTNMCSLIKCMVYCIVLSSLGCRFKNSQIVIIFFKHEHLLKVLVKLWRFCWL